MAVSQYPDPNSNYLICTSSTRPSAPFEGLKIMETDTDREYIYTGSAWLYTGGGHPRLHSFRAWRSAAHGALASSAWSTIFFDSEHWDPNNNFDSVTTSNYTVPVTGTYHWASTVLIQLNNNPQRAVISLCINGSERDRGNDFTIRGGSTNDAWGLHGAGILSLTAGDTAQIQVFNGGPNTIGLEEGSMVMWFEMDRIY